jgi:hypothetical protein
MPSTVVIVFRDVRYRDREDNENDSPTVTYMEPYADLNVVVHQGGEDMERSNISGDAV